MEARSSLRRALILIAVLGILALASTFAPKSADALCAWPEEEGQWVNTDPNTRGLTRIDVRFVCQDQVLNGKPYPPGAPWYVHLYGSCHPTDCDWGEVEAERIGTGHLYAYYDHGFARRYVYVKMSQYRPGQLWVWMWTDFVSPSRADYGMHNWFRRQ